MSKRRRAGLITLAVILVFSTVIYLRSNRFVANSDPVSYLVSLEENPDRATVEARFTLEDTLLYSTHEGPNPKAYAPHIRNLQVHSESGTPLDVAPCSGWQVARCNLWNGWERGQKWLIEAGAGTPVVVTYNVPLEYDPAEWPAGLDSAAFQGDWGVFFTGRALFLMNGRIRSPFVSANLAWMEGTLVPSEDSRQGIRVIFDLPEGWRASTPWTMTDNSFVADDLIALSESMLMLGTQDTFQTEAGGTALTLALGGEGVLGESERLQRAFREVHAYYTDVLGGPPKTTRENPLKRAIVVVNSGEVSDGEVIGNNLSVTFAEGQPLFEVSTFQTPQDERLILPVQVVFHEFFHLWNGTTFASNSEAEWFKEGVTDYYALRAARQLGYLDRAALFTLLGDQYRRYVAARAASDLSLTEAGQDEFGNHELLYPGGLLTGLCLDLIIRSKTGNDKGLDDLMKRVYTEYGASGKALSTAAVQTLAEEVSGTDLADFFEAYVEDANTVPLTECMNLAGLDATFENGRLMVEEGNSSSLTEAVRASVF